MIEIEKNGTVVATGNGIRVLQLLSLRGALKLEMIGLKRRGPSALKIAKSVTGLKGDRAVQLARIEEMIAEAKANTAVVVEG